jgi:hypothetical protein
MEMNDTRKPLLYLIVSVDTESSDSPRGRERTDLLLPMFYGKIGDSFWGFPKIMEICDRHRCQATFFVSVFQYRQYGENSIQEVCRKICEKGHDVQLHTHPIWAYDRRYMYDFTLPEQIKIIGHGAELLEKWTGSRPVAHRAGGYGMNEDTFAALEANAIAVDSSVFHGEPRCRFAPTRNRVIETGRVVELPVTICHVKPEISLGPLTFKQSPRYMKTDIDAASLEVLLRFVEEAKASHLRVMNLFLHSYSFLNFDSSFSCVRPDQGEVEKFDRFLAAVTGDPDIQIISVKRFHELYLENPEVFTGASDDIPEIKTRLGTIPTLQLGWRHLRTYRGRVV